MFTMYEKIDKLPDSMCFDSGTEICHYEDGNDTVDIEVRGYVTVYFENETYRHFTDMPKKLQNLFITGDAYKDDRIVIDENNWYEVFFNYDEDYDVTDVEGFTPEELESNCKEWMELFRQQE